MKMIKMTTSRWGNKIVKTNGEIKRLRFDQAEILPLLKNIYFLSIQVLLLFIQTYGVKIFESMLSKCFSFLQSRMCFALLKNYKIPILNDAMTIKTIVSVKQFLRNFLITFSKLSMFTFIIIKPITKFDFRFPNVGDFTTNCSFSQIENSFGITC